MDKATIDLITWIKNIPKTEIHIHSEAVVSINTFMTLNSKYNIDSNLKSEEDYQKYLHIKNLSDMIRQFLYLQSFFREKEDYQCMTKDLLNYALSNNIYYMEIFFSPSKLLELGYVDFFDVLDELNTSFDKFETDYNVSIKIIIDVSRSFGPENAMNNLNLLLEYLSTRAQSRILGIGLGGAELGNSCTEYKEVFARARKEKLHLVAHAGEEVDSTSIWDAIQELHVERIGHGTSAIYDNKLMGYLKRKKLPLEICPTSNIITGKYVQQMSQHPLREFYDEGINVTLNSDDPLLFNTSLNKEYFKLYKFLGFTKEELINITKNGLFATFLPQNEKTKRWKQILKILAKN